MNILLQYDPDSGALRKKDGTLICYVTTELEDHELKEDYKDKLSPGSRAMAEEWERKYNLPYPNLPEDSIRYSSPMGDTTIKCGKPDDGISERITNAKNPYNERESIMADSFIAGVKPGKAPGKAPTKDSEKKLIEDLERLKNIFTVDEIIKLSDAGLI